GTRRAWRDNEGASPGGGGGAIQSRAAREGENAEVKRWILEFSAQPATRAEALEAMATSFDSQFEKYFRRHLDDPDTGVCVQAIMGAGLLQVESEAPRLVPYFKDDELRDRALPAYA